MQRCYFDSNLFSIYMYHHTHIQKHYDTWVVGATQQGAATTGCGYNWVRLQLGAATTWCAYNRVWLQCRVRAKVGATSTGMGSFKTTFLLQIFPEISQRQLENAII